VATISKATLATRVLQRLAIIPAGESPSADDDALVQAKIDTAWSKLRGLGVLTFTSSTLATAIPEWAQDELERYVAAEVAPHFGKQVNKDAEQFAAEKELRRQSASHRHQVRVTPDYF
jgi:hypothetical protein